MWFQRRSVLTGTSDLPTDWIISLKKPARVPIRVCIYVHVRTQPCCWGVLSGVNAFSQAANPGKPNLAHYPQTA